VKNEEIGFDPISPLRVRFFRRVGIFTGASLNFSQRGVSLSLGVRALI